MQSSELFLISTELRNPFPPKKCIELARLSGTDRDDYMMVYVEPAFSEDIYGLKYKLDKVIIATRFKWDSLFPLSSDSVSIYICESQEVFMSTGIIDGEKLKILDKGEVFLHYNDAQRNNKSRA